MRMPQYAGVSDYRRPSALLWHDCPVDFDRGAFGMAGDGACIVEDFTQGIITGKQVATVIDVSETDATFAMLDAVNGLAELNAGTDANEFGGVQVQFGGGSTTGEMFKPTANKKIWGEARLYVTGAPLMFWGLAQQDTTLVTSNALTSQGLGFQSFTADRVMLGMAKDGSSTTTAASMGTLTASTFVKLGFKVTGTGLIQFYVDGLLKANTVVANIPVTEMKVSFTCHEALPLAATVVVDWFRVFQER